LNHDHHFTHLKEYPVRNSSLRHRLLALLLAATIICQPLLSAGGIAHAQEGTIYLPMISTPPGPPAIAISSPFAGSTVGGVFVFAAAPTSAQPIDRVQFRVGETVLGEDTSAGDGFRIFVEGESLPAGQVTLTAIATGPGGQASDSVSVQLVLEPAQSGVITTNGDGVFATETGSIIALRPGAGTPNQPIFVDELTQAEVTEQHKIDWEAMGVTFLGAQEISSQSPITLPLASVTSAGFANRVQPGQAIVNYRLQPDADGDGVSEIVVVNTASIAPNGDVVADAVSRPSVVDTPGTRAITALSGPPGFLLEIPVVGFNIHASRSNRALFTSLTEEVEVAGSVYVDPQQPAQQIFRVAIPYMQPGAATIVLRNESVMDAADPLPLTIETLPALTRPADQVFNELFDTYAQAVTQKVASLPDYSEPARLDAVTQAGQDLTDKLAELKDAYADFYTLLAGTSIPEPAVKAEVDKVIGHMNSAAAMVEANGVARLAALWLATPITGAATATCREPFTPNNPADSVADFIISLLTPPYIGTSWSNAATAGLTAATLTAAVVGASPATVTALGVLAGAAATVVVAEAATTLINDLFGNVNKGLEYANRQNSNECKKVPPPPPCPPGQSNNGPTGMGSAPPPGGNGCGGASGRSGGLAQRGLSTSLAGRIAVKIYVNGSPTPFSGLTDAGGYFFVPLIPADEPFTAIAFDRDSGETRTYRGVGPRTDDSILFFFDFNAPDNSTSIRWDGGGDGSSWADARNWDLDRLPLGEDRVAIDAAPGRTVIITDTVDVVSLRSDAALTVDQGRLTVRAASAVNNSFTLTPDARLRVDGIAARFSVSGTTLISGTLWAFNGGQIAMPQATILDGDTDERAEIIASGQGSLIDLSGVTSVLGNTRTGFFGSVFYYQIAALDAARINLSGLTAIPSGRILGSVSGADSRIDFASLMEMGDRSKFVAADNGQISLTQATNLHSVSLELLQNGQISTTQAISLTSAFVKVTGQPLEFPNVTTIDSSRFEIYEGGSLTFPAVTSYTGSDDAVISEWYVRHAGSRLSFPAMQTLRGNSFVNSALEVTARDGAKVDLPQLTTIPSGKVQFVALQADSEIDLSSLTRFERSGRGSSKMSATDGGRILSPKLTDLTGVELTLDNLSGLNTAQIITLTSGSVEVTGVAPDFGNLVNADGASLLVRNGGVLTLPKLATYTGDGLDLFTTLRAEGAGSHLDFPALTQVDGNSFTFDNLNVQASEGGVVRMPNVARIDVGMVQFEAEGAGSLVDLRSLADFSRSNTGTSSLRTLAGGAIQTGNVLRTERVAVMVEAGGVYTLTSLILGAGSTLVGGGAFPASVVNGGEVAPDETSSTQRTESLPVETLGEGEALPAPDPRQERALLGPGMMQINGAYTQLITGTLRMEIGGPSATDQLVVTGDVQLDGELALELINDYEPVMGDSFTILTGGAVSGVFSEITNAEIDETRRFDVTYTAESVVVTVVAP
jgi:hypothetical protein